MKKTTAPARRKCGQVAERSDFKEGKLALQRECGRRWGKKAGRAAPPRGFGHHCGALGSPGRVQAGRADDKDTRQCYGSKDLL